MSHARTTATPTPATSGAAPAAAPSSLPAALRLQRAAGNYAVGQLLQAKLELGSPHDPAEREADRAADAVMSETPEKPCTCGTPGAGACEKCRNKGVTVARSPSGAAVATGPAPPIVHAVLGGSGQPLASGMRSFMEGRFGQDFSAVRIHTHSQAAESAQAIGARAYAVGRDVVFGAGQYAPDTSTGRRLLAHELAHVVQQGGETVRRDPNPGGGGMTSPTAPASVPAAEPNQSTARPRPKPVTLPPGTPTVTIGGVQIAKSNPFVRQQLEAYWMQNGRIKTQELVTSIISLVSDETKVRAGLAGMDADTFKACQQIVTTEFAAMNRDADQFKKEFAEKATTLTKDLLTHSEEKIQGELARYGITLTKYCSLIACHGSFTATPTEQLAQLPTAAKELAAKRREVDKAGNQYAVANKKMKEKALILVFQVYDATLEAAANEARKAWLAQEEQYTAARKEKEAQFPILAVYSTAKDAAAQLDALAAKPQGSLAETVADKARKALDDIATVRSEFGGRFSIWKQPHIVNATKEMMHPEPYLSRTIDDTVAAVQEAEASSKLLFGLVAIGLGLAAAIPTGGSSLVAAAVATAAVAGAGLSIYTAYESYMEYALQSAAMGTDYDKAKSISQDEPSLFWLALDIVAAVIDVSAAIKATKTLIELEKARRMFGEFRDLVKLAEGGNAAAAEQLLERSSQLSEEAAAKIRDRLTKVFPTKELEGAVEVASTAAGQVKVTPNGQLFLCSSPCVQLRARFSLILEKDSQLNARLAELEGQAAKAGATKAKGFGAALGKLASDLKLADSQFRAAYLMKFLPALASEFPILKQLPITEEALVRILQKSQTSVNRIKGQILEELFAVWMKAQTPEELAKLAGSKGAKAAEKAGAAIEFIAGHRIKDAVGRELTDGVLAFKDAKGRWNIVAIFESKSGQFAADSLLKPMDLKQLRSASPAEYFSLRAHAVRELQAADPKLAEVSFKELTTDAKYTERLERTMQEIQSSEYGQARRDIERLEANYRKSSTPIRIDGEPAVATGVRPSTGIVAVVPSDVATDAIKAGLEGEQIGFSVKKMDVTQKELIELADHIAWFASTAK